MPDELWVLFRPVVPPTAVMCPQGGGRRRASDGEALAAIILVATSGYTWRQLPPVYGPSCQTVYRRLAQWSRARIWARLHRVILDELDARGELGCRGVRSTPSGYWHRRGALTGPNPTGRAKPGSRRQGLRLQPPAPMAPNAASVNASPAEASSHRNGSAATGGLPNIPCPGSPAAVGSTADTSARPNTSSLATAPSRCPG